MSGPWATERLDSIGYGCDAGVTQNRPTLTKLTSLTVLAGSDSRTYVFAMRPGEFGLQVRLPQSFLFNYLPSPKFDCDAGVTHGSMCG